MSDDLDDALSTVASEGSIVFLGLVIELGISFLAKLVIARVLGPLEYGVVSLGVTTMIVVSTLVLGGLDIGVARFLPRFDDASDRRGVLIAAFGIAMPVAVAAGGLVVMFAPTIATELFRDPAVTPVLRVFGPIIPIAALLKLDVGVSQGLEAARPKVLIRNIILPLTRFVAIAVVIVAGFGAVGVAWAYGVAYFCAATVGLVIVARETSLFERAISPTPYKRTLVAFSLPLVISAAMTFIFSDVDTFMLGYFSPTADVGTYNTVYPLAHLLVVPMSSVGFIVMPVLSRLHERGDTDTMATLYQRTTKWIFLGAFPIFGLLVCFPTELIGLTFGGAYTHGATALRVLALAFFTHAIAGPNLDCLTAIGKTRLVMVDDLVVALLNMGLNLLLIPRFSFFGAAIATAVAYGTLNVLYTTQLYRATGMHPLSKSLGTIALGATLLLTIVVGTLGWLLSAPYRALALTVFLFGGGYLLFSLRVGIDQRELELLAGVDQRFDTNLRDRVEWFARP